MNLLRVSDLQKFAALRAELRDVETVPGEMGNAFRGAHDQHGEVILIQDGDGGWLIGDGVRFIAPGDEI
ncbi:hypothetical protein [Roseomonas genomospecies 6]|uniref:Uncharacterized protein n=1 Tax=Roseomonas genomospecies 6 TaxID=214106 RepID=A0A9W7KQU3_9PROT|nr:hypothetical protein [Roseomonas genomospecies 6]KAA0677792.1 hypothetical protein DS843_21980 [Roseomonas genomospecies 6]